MLVLALKFSKNHTPRRHLTACNRTASTQPHHTTPAGPGHKEGDKLPQNRREDKTTSNQPHQEDEPTISMEDSQRSTSAPTRIYQLRTTQTVIIEEDKTP
jgi:hypothetical protein